MYGLRALDYESGQLPDGSHQDSTWKTNQHPSGKDIVTRPEKTGYGLGTRVLRWRRRNLEHGERTMA